MIRRLLLTALSLLSISGATAAGISYPEAPGPNPDHLITPPQENVYFYVRPDGQAYTLQLETTQNMTEFLNRHYYDSAWEGMQWSPWDVTTTIQKQVRSLGLFPEYNAANVFGVCNGWNRFFEVYSGFGPGPGYGSLK